MQKITRCFLIYFLISGLFLVSCNHQKKQITEALSQMMDKEIVFPNALQAKILGRDTIVDVLEKPGYKIITYADSSGCTDCRLNLYGWKLKMDQAKAWNKPVDFVFILQPKEESDLVGNTISNSGLWNLYKETIESQP
ncbi:MAG: hypothetical protein PHS48_05890 [Bacteroidales bacterium]|nr:hypothetical protein [Bacteroidales bacterium]